MKIVKGNYYIGESDIIKIMQIVNGKELHTIDPFLALFSKTNENYYKVRRATNEGIGWSIIREQEILSTYEPCDLKTLKDVQKVFNSDPNSKL